MPQRSEAEEVAGNFYAALDRHGYGFQFAVLQAAADLFGEKRSPWRLPVAEFPVEVRGHGTRIDIVFEHRHSPKYLICECKRVNPALSHWCFAKMPKSLVGDKISAVSYEVVRRTDQGVRVSLSGPDYPRDVYQIAQEVRSGEKGEAFSQGRGVIEEAATQVLRGVNGLVNYFQQHPQEIAHHGTAKLTPVIFTTATLWVSKMDLSSASLDTGKIERGEIALEKRGVVYYQYTQSPGLRHLVDNLEVPEGQRGFQEMIYRDYMRGIVVVSSSGVEEFLTSEGIF